MNNRIFKRIFSVLVSLSIILGVNNFCYADGADITKTTASVIFEPSNTGLTTNDTVSFKVYVKFIPDEAVEFSSIKVVSMCVTVKPSENLASPSFAPVEALPGAYYNTGNSAIMWADLTNDTDVGVDIATNTNFEIGTLTYSPTEDQDPNTQVSLTAFINSEDNLSSFVDASNNYSKLPDENVECTYELQDAPACSHTSLKHFDAVPPTCTDDGTNEYWCCNSCDQLFSDENKTTPIDEPKTVSALGHNFKAYSVIDDDYHQLKCSRCPATSGEPEAHDFPADWTVETEATCAKAGSQFKTCSKCGHKITQTIEAKGHSFGEYKSNNDATCTKDGTKTRTCTVCGEEETIADEGSATGHDYGTQVVAATSTTLGGTRHRCYNCGDEFWTDFTKNDNYAQVNMPNGETVYHYCTHNGLATETTVDLGDGTTLRVFLQDPLRVLKKNDDDVLDVIVTYIPEGSSRYKELMAKNDADHAHEHIKLFEVYPAVNGRPVTGALDGSVYMEYEIPDGWDENELEMILVRDGEDQDFEETVLEIDGRKYLAMWKNHFSPYAMIDKLSDEEKALLNSLPDDKKQELLDAVEQFEKAVEAESNESAEKSEEKSSSNNVKTGDNSGSIAVLALSTLITTGLYLELFMKKKRNV